MQSTTIDIDIRFKFVRTVKKLFTTDFNFLKLKYHSLTPILMLYFSKTPISRITKKTLAALLVLVIVLSVKTVTDRLSTESYSSSVYAENFDSSKSYFDGYNLFILERADAISQILIDRKILITDMDNNTVLEKEIPTNIALADIQFYNTTTILFGDSGSTKMWNIVTDEIVNLGFGGHHDIEINYLNNTFLTLDIYQIEIESNTYVYDNITEYDSSGMLVRSLDTRNYVEPEQLCPFLTVANISIDLTHANSICFDEDEQMLYLNCRNINTFYKIDYNTGDLIWGLGEYGNFTMYDIYGNEREHLFFHSHSLEKIFGNRFLLFDNDFHNQTNAINKQSRYVEITIDEDTMTANVTREWISPTEYFSPIWGDCDLLPNNNMLGVFGYTQYLGQETGSKVVEVNEKGEIVWLLESPLEQEIKYTIYKIERFRFTPIVSAPNMISSVNSSYFEWDVWYNFKSKTSFNGEYYVYLDNQIVKSDNITFPKYWESMQINYTAENLKPGKHEISLIVKDDQGHFSNDSDFYTGGFEFKIKQSVGVVIGIGLGVGIPIVATTVFIGRKYIRKRSKIE